MPQGRVTGCEMVCDHQQVITKVSACTDISGTITQENCFSKGQVAGGKCVWTAYTTKEGGKKTVCGPCEVNGVGTIQPSSVGSEGPEPNSTVEATASQCPPPEQPAEEQVNQVLNQDAEEEGAEDSENSTGGSLKGNARRGQRCEPPNLYDCPEAHMVGRAVEPSPMPLKVLGLETAPGAPQYVAVPVLPPYGQKEFTEASAVAARAAGWKVGSILPPDAAVAIYGPPPMQGPRLPSHMKVMYEAPPPGVLGMPVKPGSLAGTVPPPEEVAKSRKDMEEAQREGSGASLLALRSIGSHLHRRLRGWQHPWH
jgi:hypothetical protein